MNILIRQHLSTLALLASVVLLFAGKIFTALLFCGCLVMVKWLMAKRGEL